MTQQLCLFITVAVGLIAAVVPCRYAQSSGTVLGAKLGNAVYYNGYGQGLYGGNLYDTFNFSGYGDGPYGYGSGSAYEFPSNGGYGYGHGSYYDDSGVLHFRRSFYESRNRRCGHGLYGSLQRRLVTLPRKSIVASD